MSSLTKRAPKITIASIALALVVGSSTAVAAPMPSAALPGTTSLGATLLGASGEVGLRAISRAPLATPASATQGLAVLPMAVTPDPPLDIQDPVQVFAENFENGWGSTPTKTKKLESYVGSNGTTYTPTSGTRWGDITQCNGVVLSYNSSSISDFTPAGGNQVACNLRERGRQVQDTSGQAANVRRMADVLGQLYVTSGGSGSGTKSSPWNRSNSATKSNHAVTAFTYDAETRGSQIFESNVLPSTSTTPRFYTASIDVAELSCDYNNRSANSRLRFALKMANGTIVPLSAVDASNNPIQIMACRDNAVKYYTSPEVYQGWANGGSWVAAGTYYSSKAQLITYNGAKLQMYNDTTTHDGNDFAYDNIRIVDATPNLTKFFGHDEVEYDETSTLTFRVTNTGDLAEKTPWSFKDTLPDGLEVVAGSPATYKAGDRNKTTIANGCSATTTFTTEGGKSVVNINGGKLNSGTAYCDITVKVQAKQNWTEDAQSKTFENCIVRQGGTANVSNISGLDARGCATLKVTSKPKLSAEKTSNPASGTEVKPGDTVQYTFSVKNSGSAKGAISYTDFLGDIVDDAAITVNPVVTVRNAAGTQVAVGNIVLNTSNPDRFVLTGDLKAKHTVTVTYSVKVNNPSAGNLKLKNVLTTKPTPECKEADGDKCTENPVNVPTTVTIRKALTDQNGEIRTPAPGWTVGLAATSSTLAPTQATQVTDKDGKATWLVNHNSANSPTTLTIDEIQQPGYTAFTLECSVKAPAAKGKNFGALAEAMTVDQPLAAADATNTVTFPKIEMVFPGSTVDCTIVNKGKPGSVTWNKVNNPEKGEPELLGGSEWTLTGPSLSPTEPGPSKTVTDCSGTTCPAGGDQNPAAGKFELKDLAWGDYTLTETKAPAGYQIGSTEPIKFSVTGIKLDVDLKNVVNERKSGSATWSKVDESDPAQLLGGSEWTLTDPDGNETTIVDCQEAAAADCTGDDKDPAAGKFLLKGLAWGTYTLVESKAPAGYSLDDTERTFVISVEHGEASLTQELGEITNAKRDPLTIPLTGGTGTFIFLGVGGAALAAAAVAAFIRRRRSLSLA